MKLLPSSKVNFPTPFQLRPLVDWESLTPNRDFRLDEGLERVFVWLHGHLNKAILCCSTSTCS